MSEAIKEYTVEDLKNQIKPLSQNAFLRFFQRILRWWLGIWYGFCDKKPKFSALVYKVFFFVVFSMGVTIWQFIVMTFLPYAFESLNTGAVGWPMVPIAAAGGKNFIIFGDEQGWGYFIAFEIAVFTAQCINFPLQRNITYRSHGNPWYQAMWYFIGWVLVSIATNAIWGVCNAFLLHWGSPDVVNGLLKTVLTGGVSMVIFFFVFLVIFPDNNKMAKSARARYERLVAANAPAEKVAAAERKMRDWERKAALSNAEKEYAQAKSQASNKSVRYFAVPDSEQERKQAAFADAVNAIEIKDQKEKIYNDAVGQCG
ncbi:MAG: hypothetical protein K2M89_00705 [Clostridiales bacterium]|nr:hypothetical protein [Clostridiales bacterium]